MFTIQFHVQFTKDIDQLQLDMTVHGLHFYAVRVWILAEPPNELHAFCPQDIIQVL